MRAHPDHPRPRAEGLLLLSSSDFLKDRRPWYAGRARRKKVALIEIEARNAAASPVTVDFARARLRAEGRSCEADQRDAVIGKLSTFQWDFLFYWILHFSVVELAIELLIFFAGALFNRSLRKQLSSILDGQVTLQPGQRLKGLVAFKNASRVSAAEVEVPWSPGGTHLEWARVALEASG